MREPHPRDVLFEFSDPSMPPPRAVYTASARPSQPQFNVVTCRHARALATGINGHRIDSRISSDALVAYRLRLTTSEHQNHRRMVLRGRRARKVRGGLLLLSTEVKPL